MVHENGWRLPVHRYLYIAVQSNWVLNLTAQSNQVLQLALLNYLIGLFKKRCTIQFMQWLYILTDLPVSYERIAILLPVKQQGTGKNYKIIVKNRDPPLDLQLTTWLSVIDCSPL